MNSVLQDMREIVWAAAPGLRKYGTQGPAPPGKLSHVFGSKSARDYLEWRKLWASLKPVRFGFSINWSVATAYTLAQYQVPRDFFNLVLHVRTYVVNWTAAATDLGRKEPPPPGYAYWQYDSFSLPATPAQVLTDTTMPIHVMADDWVHEFLLFRGGFNITLIGNITAASPNDNTREIRTVVYSYNCGTEIQDRIGSNQAIAQITA